MSADEAVAFFTQGFNCAQAVLAAQAAELGLPLELCLKIAAALGGGMARTGATCGAVTGALLVVGLRLGNDSSSDQASKERCYAACRTLMDRFRQRHGTLTCKELIGCDLSTPEGAGEAKARAVHANLCPAFVRSSVEILEGILPQAVQQVREGGSDRRLPT